MADNRKTISELTELPGNLSLAALLAIVQGGVSYHATGEQVSNMVLGNITVTENANGMSVRIPGPNLQICAHFTPAATLDEGSSSSGYRTPTQSWNYPQSFSAAPIVVGTPHIAGGHIFGVRLNDVTQNSTSYRIYGLDAGAQGRLMMIAIGKY